MRNPHAWDEVVHAQWHGDWHEKYEHWSLDFSTTPPREYKEDRGMRVYRNGMVEMRSLGVRNPNQRADMLHRYGMCFDSPRREGLRFFTPDGQKVPKTSIQDSILFFSGKHGVALAGNHTNPITLYSEDAFPVGPGQVTTKVPDKQKVDAILAANEEQLKAAAVEAVLGNVTASGKFFTVRDWVRVAEPWPSTFMADEQRKAVGYCYHTGELQRMLLRRHMITHKHDFLRFTEV